MTAKKMALVLAMALTPHLAYGNQVTYSTSATISGPGESFVTFTGVSNSVSVNAHGAHNQPFGSLDINCPLGCDLDGTKVTFTITQTLPTTGTGSTTATLSGTLTSSGGTFRLVWLQSIGVNRITYVPYTILATCTGGTCTVPLTTRVFDDTAPEPSTELLLGLGILGLMGLATASRKLIST